MRAPLLQVSICPTSLNIASIVLVKMETAVLVWFKLQRERVKMRKILGSAAALMLMVTPLLADNCGVLCKLDWWKSATTIEIDTAVASVDPKARNANGFTPLHLAAIYGTPENISDLLQAGIDPNVRVDKWGLTPLYFAGFTGTPEKIFVLARAGADPNALNSSGSPLLLRAVAMGPLENIKALLEVGADPNLRNKQIGGRTSLQLAIVATSSDRVSVLLKAGADPNVREDTGGETTLLLAINNAKIEYLSMLLNAGANPNLRNNQGITPLHFAAAHRSPEGVNVLLKAGAELDPQDKDGWTPLHYAILNRPSENISVLLKAGADASLTNNSEQTAFDLAQKYDKLVGTDAYEQLKAASIK